MDVKNTIKRDFLITFVSLSVCFLLSILMQKVFETPEQVTTAFSFTVFMISFLTNGYCWGLIAAFLSVMLVNYAFTFPFFALNFKIPANLFSAIIMAMISFFTSTLTTKIKIHEAAKAESAKERERTNLLRAISHDLRTPLTTIYGSSTVLLESEDSFTDSQKKNMLKGIQEDALWLTRIVENLLSITRVDGENIRLEKTSTACDELIDSVINKFRKHYPNQKVLLNLPENLVFIPIDALLIEQVLLNLLENVIHHACGFTKIMLNVIANNGKATFEVIDDGCGIEEKKMRDLFKMMPSSETPSADALKRNAGIGLNVCSTIVKAHGSEMHAVNLPEGGAKFFFTLDVDEEIYE